MRGAVVALTVGIIAALSLPDPAGSQQQSKPHTGAPAAPGSMTGKVIETLDASGYTYVHVDTGARKIWAAAPAFAVSLGDEVTVPPGAAMRNFHSKTLDRSFETIYFVSEIRVVGSGQKKPGPGSAHAGLQTGAAAATLDLSGIARAEGGKTVAEILDAGAALSGQEIAVRGRVAKYLPRILGTNFLHLRDGTTASGGTDYLTVTTGAVVEVGALVLVRGVVKTDRDLGNGYRYDLIIEDASVTGE